MKPFTQERISKMLAVMYFENNETFFREILVALLPHLVEKQNPITIFIDE